MRFEGAAIRPRVLDHENQANGSLVAFGEQLALAVGSPILTLEVTGEPFDLRSDDLGRPEERGVDRLAVLAYEQLRGRLPYRVRLPAKTLDDGELAGVAQ